MLSLVYRFERKHRVLFILFPIDNYLYTIQGKGKQIRPRFVYERKKHLPTLYHTNAFCDSLHNIPVKSSWPNTTAQLERINTKARIKKFDGIAAKLPSVFPTSHYVLAIMKHTNVHRGSFLPSIPYLSAMQSHALARAHLLRMRCNLIARSAHARSRRADNESMKYISSDIKNSRSIELYSSSQLQVCYSQSSGFRRFAERLSLVVQFSVLVQGESGRIVYQCYGFFTLDRRSQCLGDLRQVHVYKLIVCSTFHKSSSTQIPLFRIN